MISKKGLLNTTEPQLSPSVLKFHGQPTDKHVGRHKFHSACDIDHMTRDYHADSFNWRTNGGIPECAKLDFSASPRIPFPKNNNKTTYLLRTTDEVNASQTVSRAELFSLQRFRSGPQIFALSFIFNVKYIYIRRLLKYRTEYTFLIWLGNFRFRGICVQENAWMGNHSREFGLVMKLCSVEPLQQDIQEIKA